MQALQHDKEDLQRQLQRCTPKEFDRLHVELLGAKRKAAELPLVQEQLQRQKQLWSKAEQRLADLQAAAARGQEEAAAKQATLAAQLSTAREELAAVRKEHKQLQQQLANAQDAVKVGWVGNSWIRCAALLACWPVGRYTSSTVLAGACAGCGVTVCCAITVATQWRPWNTDKQGPEQRRRQWGATHLL